MWTREFRAFGREVEAATNEVRFKWFFSGVAGDETEEAERLKRGQIDGADGSANLCMRFSPSLRVLTIAGLFRDMDEALYVMNRMKPLLDAEFLKVGLINLAEAGMGFHVLLSRNPIRSVGAQAISLVGLESRPGARQAAVGHSPGRTAATRRGEPRL